MITHETLIFATVPNKKKKNTNTNRKRRGRGILFCALFAVNHLEEAFCVRTLGKKRVRNIHSFSTHTPRLGKVNFVPNMQQRRRKVLPGALQDKPHDELR